MSGIRLWNISKVKSSRIRSHKSSDVVGKCFLNARISMSLVFENFLSLAVFFSSFELARKLKNIFRLKYNGFSVGEFLCHEMLRWNDECFDSWNNSWSYARDVSFYEFSPFSGLIWMLLDGKIVMINWKHAVLC